MPVKSTFAVEIGEGVDKFKEFDKLFTKYQDRLGKTPSAWASVSKANKETENSFKAMTAALLAQSEIMKTEEKTQNRIESSTRRMSSYWQSISSSSRSFLNNMVSVAKHDAIIGLLGLGGSIWGLNKFGSAAGSGLKSSTGLGLSYGAMSAFGLTYNRIMEPAGFLSAVSQGRANVGGPEASAMLALGVNPMGAGNTGTTARETLRKIYDMAQKTPEHLLGPMMVEGFGLGSMNVGVEDLRRMKGMSRGEFEKYSSQFDTRSNQLGVSEGTLRKWQDFVNTLDVTGKRIESSLIRGLANAAGPLEKLSDAAATVVEKFVGSKGFEWVINKLTGWADTFGNYLGTEKFKQDMRDIADGFAAVAQWVMKFARWIGNGASNPQTSNAVPGGGNIPSTQGLPGLFTRWFSRPSTSNVKTLPDGTPILDSMPQGYAPTTPTAGTLAGVGDLLKLVAKLEGSPDINGVPQVSPAGAIGKYQIMPSTAAGYGVSADQLRDPATNEATATRLLNDLSKRYNTTAQILTAYNAGPQIADYMKAHGDRSLPSKRPSDGGDWNYRETQEYLRRAGIRVTIDNPAGSTVATQSDMLGGSYPGVVP